MQGDARTGADLVPDGAHGQLMPVMGVERVDAGRIGERGAGGGLRVRSVQGRPQT